MKQYLSARLYAPKPRKTSNATSKPEMLNSLATDLENQKTQCKAKKQKNLVIQTNFEIEPSNRHPTPKTTVFSGFPVERQLFYPKSCKNARFSPQTRGKYIFDEMIAFPRTAKNSPGLEMEKQARMVFSSKDAKNDKSMHFFVSHKRDSGLSKKPNIKQKVNTKDLYKKNISRPNLSLKAKLSQKENSMLKYNRPFSKTNTDISISYASRTKTQSLKIKQINYFNLQKLNMKAICYFMDCTENLMNYSLTLNIGISDNTYFENYTELINVNDLISAEEVFNTEKGQVVKTYLKYEYFLTVLILHLNQQLMDNVDEITELLKICVDNRFIVLNLLKTEPDIKTPSKTLIEEFTDDAGYSKRITDREATFNVFTDNTNQLVKSIEYIALIVSDKTSELIRSVIKGVQEVDICDFVTICSELFKNTELKLKDENIYQNLKPKKPNFIIQPYRTNNLLPAKSSNLEYTLVLDLDETLIHCKRQENKGRILLRPHVKEFLTEMSKYYEIVVFTAADKQYADWVLDRLDTVGVISHRLYRCSTSNQNGFIFKDLCKLGRDLTKLLLVDNKPENFAFQPENGIEILSWYDDPLDNALLELKELLVRIGRRPGLDLRVALKECIDSFE